MCGIGVYERGTFKSWCDGKNAKEYNLWISMLHRCIVGGKIQKIKPAYIGCEVHPDFIKYQDFAEWCQNQIGFGVPGFQLDKDLLVDGNKVYGPDTCVFIPGELNSLIIRNERIRGTLPTGVSYEVTRNRYKSALSIAGKNLHIGWFKDAESAGLAYVARKTIEVLKLADTWKDSIDPRAHSALINWVPR